MLARSSYPKSYIDDCGREVDRQVARYRALVAAGAGLTAAAKTEFEAARRDFEPVFFNNMVVELEFRFVHRLRAKELKDGNPLNEVRLLATSLAENGGRMIADKQVKLDPRTSVLGYRVGDAIEIRAADFDALAKGFFADLEAKYLAG